MDNGAETRRGLFSALLPVIGVVWAVAIWAYNALVRRYLVAEGDVHSAFALACVDPANRELLFVGSNVCAWTMLHSATFFLLSWIVDAKISSKSHFARVMGALLVSLMGLGWFLLEPVIYKHESGLEGNGSDVCRFDIVYRNTWRPNAVDLMFNGIGTKLVHAHPAIGAFFTCSLARHCTQGQGIYFLLVGVDSLTTLVNGKRFAQA